MISGVIYYILANKEAAPQKTENLPVFWNDLSREELMNDCMTKIGEISPVRPILGGEWRINRFWFPRDLDEDFYIEYEDGHNLRQVLVSAAMVNNILNYEIVGYFEPGENNWKLKQGEDKFFGEHLDLYEYNEELEKWVKKN